MNCLVVCRQSHTIDCPSIRQNEPDDCQVIANGTALSFTITIERSPVYYLLLPSTLARSF